MNTKNIELALICLVMFWISGCETPMPPAITGETPASGGLGYHYRLEPDRIVVEGDKP